MSLQPFSGFPAADSAPARAPVALTLITGVDHAAKAACLRQVLATRPAAQSWAVLLNDPGLGAKLVADAAGDPPSLRVIELAGGCVCCAAQVAMLVHLRKLLKDQPQRIVLLLSSVGQPADAVDAIRRGLGAAVQLQQIIAAINASRPPPVGLAASDEVGPASVSMLMSANVWALTDGEHAANWAAMAQQVWPARECLSMAALSALTWLTEPSGAQQAVAAATGLLPSQTRAQGPIWRWPGSTVFDRQRLSSALPQELAALAPLQAQGVFQTARAWYRVQWVDQQWRWAESHWRLDSRWEMLWPDAGGVDRNEKQRLEIVAVQAIDACASVKAFNKPVSRP